MTSHVYWPNPGDEGYAFYTDKEVTWPKKAVADPVILFRAAAQAQLLLATLSSFSIDLANGPIVMLRQDRVRIRQLA